VFVRLFSSAIDPNDLADVRRIFGEDIAPVFESMPGCHLHGAAPRSRTQRRRAGRRAALLPVEVARRAHRAIESRAVAESMSDPAFLQLEPVIRMFETAE